MLEILIVWKLSKRIAALVKAKGRSPAGYVLLFIMMWFGGEISGGIGVAVFSTIMTGPAGEPNTLFVYVGALMGAAIGAAVTFLIANSLADVRDEYSLRAGDFDDREWRDRDSEKNFGSSNPNRDGFAAEPNELPRRQDDRYKAE